MAARIYLTTSIPYVNSRPHVGHALEFVEADLLARAYRAAGREVRFQSGTDDHALKNVRAAEEAGVPVADHVGANAAAFADLWSRLDLTLDDTIRTSTDPRHRPGVEKLWRACVQSGDLYERDYRGLYCVGCEEFYAEDDLDDGRCPEHLQPVEEVVERNWFFRLSRYGDALRDAITSGNLRIDPAARCNEVLAVIERGLEDFSVSRDATRARGWGIPVPGDGAQVISVWYDALGNYLTALGYGGDERLFDAWWRGAGERVHVIGKGIVRQHGLYWPAVLLSAGLPLPTRLAVHSYLTVDGKKIGKSLGNAVDPAGVIDVYGVDAFRWWLASEVPLSADADFSIERLVEVANRDLANGIGNLVGRITALQRRLGPGTEVGPIDESAPLAVAAAALGGRLLTALERFEIRRATQLLTGFVAEANRYLETTRPWEDADGPRRAAVIATAATAARSAVDWFAPFVPALAARATARLDGEPASGPLFPRLTSTLAARAQGVPRRRVG